MLSRSKQQAALHRELVGVTEVAARLSLTAERVRQLAKSGAMPEPLGELGRRVVWDWRDVEAWAHGEGRLLPAGDDSRQIAQPWRQRPRGSLRLVVDEIMRWGQRDRDVCHVRVWSPPAGIPEAQIVLLGQLQDQVSSVTNNVEQVAMVAAARYLGPAWRAAQIYQYSPATLLDDGDVFLNVRFTIRVVRGGGHRRGPSNRTAAVRVLGAELIDPDWRPTSIGELEHLTGDSPRIWASGTYTRALVEAVNTSTGPLELVWDPDRAEDLSALAAAIAKPDVDEIGALRVGLTEPQRRALDHLVSSAALDAHETARQDIASQPIDAAIALRPPRLIGEAGLPRTTSRGRLEDIDPHVLWDTLMMLREAMVNRCFDVSEGVERQRLLLVPGLHGGWVPLHWTDAGVAEPQSPREGWGGTVALPDDLIVPGQDIPPADSIQRTELLLDTLANHLAEAWSDWSWHDVPLFMPSTVVSSTGPLGRSYLDQLTWQPIASTDWARVRRLTNEDQLAWAGIDPDGWLVAVPKDRRWFTCEWPVSGPVDPALEGCAIRADRSDRHGSTPVYLTHPDGRIGLLPSAGHRHRGNSYAWGYGGGGPWNFTAAVVDLLTRADPDLDAATAEEVVFELVAGPRTPDWQVSDLLAETRRRRPRGSPTVKPRQ